MTASAHYVGALAGVLETLGFSAEDALAACKIDTRFIELNPSARIGLDCVRRMFDAAEAALGDPQVGLRTGHRFRIANYGKTGSIYAYANDLHDVAALNARYQRLAIDMGEITVDEAGTSMCFEPYYDDRYAYRHVTAMLMGAYATAYRWLSWGSGHDLLSISMPYPEPEDGGELAASLLSCPIKFGETLGRVTLSAEAVSMPLPLSDSEKRARTVAQLDAMMGASEAKLSFQNAIRAAMRGGLEAGRLNAAVLAERLEMSDGALRKRMREAGLTYQQELDAVRQERVVAMIQRGESFAHIAAALGYNDQAAFNRAFKRWYGVAPGKWTPPDQ